MAENHLKPFLCEAIEKSVLRIEWEKWFRAFTIYLEAEQIVSPKTKKTKLLHLGGVQLQTVAFSLPGALIEHDEEQKNDVFAILVEKLDAYFSPKQNSTFERHLFRNLTPADDENFSKFVLRLRQQMYKCSFGKSKAEIEEICLKDKIIDSWAPLELRKKLLGKEHSLDEIIEACQVEEQINKQSEAMLIKHTIDTPCKITARKTKPEFDCSRCSRTGHANNDISCPARLAKCNKCLKLGHFARKCRTRQYFQPKSGNIKRRQFDVRSVEDGCPDLKRKKEIADCFKIWSDEEEELINCRIGGHDISLIIDSGSRFNLISHTDWEMLKKKNATVFNARSHSQKQFRGYASEQLLEVISVFEAPISAVPDFEVIATFFVIKNGRQSLLGRDTAIRLNVLRLGLNVNCVEETTPFPKWKGIKVKLWIDHEVKPVQQPLKRIPVALEDKVAANLKDALNRDIIEEVKGPSSWISPIVLAFKENGDIRLCVDMRVANRAIRRENYPIPTFESFMTRLKDAQYFSRLDLKDAYYQLELDETSRKITTFITPKGLFRYKRLMFGVNSAPELFQRHLEQLLITCPNAMNYIDDVVIFGASEQENDKAMKDVCKIFSENNVLLNVQKCIWKTSQLKFLGHILSDKGIEVDPDKIDAIKSFRDPIKPCDLRREIYSRHSRVHRTS